MPPSRREAWNLTASGTGQPRAKVEVWVKGACARSSKFSTSSPCSTGTSTSISACSLYPGGGGVQAGSVPGASHPGHTHTKPSAAAQGSEATAIPRQSWVEGILVQSPAPL